MKTFWIVEDNDGIVALVFTEEKARAWQDLTEGATITEKSFSEWEQYERKAEAQDHKNSGGQTLTKLERQEPEPWGRPMFYVLNPDNSVRPGTMEDWGAQWLLKDRWRVGRTVLANGCIEVSTVFLGVDHGFSDRGPPIVFETMLFVDDERPVEPMLRRLDYCDQWLRRYVSWQDALQGHNLIVKDLLRILGGFICAKDSLHRKTGT